MPVTSTVLQIIERMKPLPCPVNEHSNFYTDLGFDSLSFVALLVALEDTFSVSFRIDEMQDCLQVGKLIAAIQIKLEERESSDGQTSAAKYGKA